MDNTYILLNFKKITSKKNNKDYLIFNVLLNNDYLLKLFHGYDEMLEQYLINNTNEDISDDVQMVFDSNIMAFKPYIKYK